MPETLRWPRQSVAFFLLVTAEAIVVASCMPADRVPPEESTLNYRSTPTSTSAPPAPRVPRTTAQRHARVFIDSVDHVVDGDTVVGEQVGKVRLIGINTPELRGNRAGVACYGREAAQRLRELLPEGTAIELRLDVQERDRYDRLLAYVYRQIDGSFVNATLVEEGYAMVATIPPNVAHVNRLLDLQAEARAAQRGLWARCLENDRSSSRH